MAEVLPEPAPIPLRFETLFVSVDQTALGSTPFDDAQVAGAASRYLQEVLQAEALEVKLVEAT